MHDDRIATYLAFPMVFENIELHNDIGFKLLIFDPVPKALVVSIIPPIQH